jgi:hypothetical protein
MDLKSLGRRDIFGILLPGAIPLLIGAYALYAVLAPFQLPLWDVINQQFLLTAILFVSAYLVGSMLRLFAADQVDVRSGKYLLKAWKKKFEDSLPKDYESKFTDKLSQLVIGKELDDESSISFDEWIWITDEFPYVAWQNRMWSTRGFREVRDFFQQNYKEIMWPKLETSPKTFFNYCKLVVIDKDEALAEEVLTAEGLTRFFAGTFAGLDLSSKLLLVSFLFQVAIMIWEFFFPGTAIANGLFFEWKTQCVYLILTLMIFLAAQRMCHQITKRFRTLRAKEAETVFQAFYLLHSDRQNFDQ